VGAQAMKPEDVVREALERLGMLYCYDDDPKADGAVYVETVRVSEEALAALETLVKERDEERALITEFATAYCERDKGHSDDFAHPAWKRWEAAIKALVDKGLREPKP
jgi:hypothetical protein